MGELREIIGLAQTDKNLFKRWFTDSDYWDLYIWTDKKNEIVGIQLCYSKNLNEHALTWFKDEVFNHTKVSTRYSSAGLSGSFSGSPILVPNGIFNKDLILNKFLKDSIKLDKKIVDFVESKIKEFKD